MNTKLIEQLQTYFDGEATAEERLRIQAVIAESAECRELLKQWEQQRCVFGLLKKTEPGGEAFVSRVMNRLQEVKEPEPVVIESPEFFRWLFPAFGYALSTILVFIIFTAKQPVVSADTILLSRIPQEARGVFVRNASDISQMFATEER